MPDPDDVKYYPVLARILMRLGEGTIVCFRQTIVTKPYQLSVDHDLLHRLLTEYKGKTDTCNADEPLYVQQNRAWAVERLERRCRKRNLPDGAQFEPVTEIVIDLRNVELTTVG